MSLSLSLCLSETLWIPTSQSSRKCHSSPTLTLTVPPLLLFQPHTPPNLSNHKNPILPLSPPTSPCPFSSFHSSALSLASSALSSPFLLSGDPDPCPFSDVADPKTLSGLSTRKVTMVGAWWSGLSYLGSLVFTPGLDPPIVAWLWGRLGFLLTQMGFWGISAFCLAKLLFLENGLWSDCVLALEMEINGGFCLHVIVCSLLIWIKLNCFSIKYVKIVMGLFSVTQISLERERRFYKS